MFLVDANVLIDVISESGRFTDWSTQAIRQASEVGPIYLNPLIYAEIAATFDRPEGLDRALETYGVGRLDLPYRAAFLASQAFLKYRRAGGVRSAPLPDFFIGAHAAFEGYTLITRDAARFRTYFPDVPLIAPA